LSDHFGCGLQFTGRTISAGEEPAAMSRKSRNRKRTFEQLERRQLLFAPLEQTSLLGGLDTLADTLDEVEQHAEYAQQIPALNSTAGQIADFSEIVRDGLIEPLSSLMTASSELAPADVVDLLNGYRVADGARATSIPSGSVSVEEIDDASGAAIELTATLQQTRTVQETLRDFGDAAWISWGDVAPEVSLEALTELTITIGVDRVGQEFYARLGEMTTSINVDTSDLSGDLQVGPLGTKVIDGRVQMNAELLTDFGVQDLTANEIQGTSLSHLVVVSADGSLEADFDTEFTIGDFSGNESFAWSDSATFDETLELPALGETGDLIRMTRIDQEDLRGFFNQIGTKLDELLQALDADEADGFGQDFCPWLNELELPDLSGLSDRFREIVEGGLSDEENQADFSTFEVLRQRLETLTQGDTLLSYVPDTAELTFEFQVAAARTLNEIDLSAGTDYGALAGIELDGSATTTGEFLLSGLFGVDLNPLEEDTTPDDISDDDSWAEHFFIDDVTLAADVTVETESASAAARLGFIGLSVGQASVTADAALAIELADESRSDGRITFKRLSELILGAPGDLISSSTLTGSAELSLQDIDAEGIPGLELDDGTITVGIDDLSDPSTFAIELNEALQNVNALSTVTIDQWVEMAGDVIDLLDSLTTEGKWDEALPGVGTSVNALLDQAAKLQQAVDALLETDGATIQELGEQFELLLEDALELPPELLDVLLVWQNDTLEMAVNFRANVQSDRRLSVDLAELMGASSDDTTQFDLLADLVDVGGQSSIQASTSLDASLVFGADISDVIAGNSTRPTLYVADSTGVDAEIELTASDINASVAAGPLGLFIRNGQLTLDADGDAATTGAAQLSAGLVTNTNGRYPLDEIDSLSPAEIETNFAAGASLVLPLYFPTESDPVGGSEVDRANAIVVGIGNIAGLFNDEDPQVTLQAPDLNTLIEDFDPASEGLRVLAEGLEALLIKIEDLLREQVLSQELPMVGNKLESAADFLREVREDALPILRDELQPGQLVDEVKQVLYDALGDVMRLVDANNDGRIDHRDIALLLDSANQEVTLDLWLGGTYQVGAGIDFDLGLPGVGLELEGGVEATLDWSLDITVGVDRSNGFYVDTTDVNELEMGVLVTLPQAELTGRLGLMQITATDQGSSFQANFDVDLKDASGDGLLTFNELVASVGTSGDLVDASLTGAADINFGLVAGTSFAALPELHADFVLNWNFDGNDLQGSLERVAIENISLDLGSFISGFAGDILGRVQSVLEPIEPIVDVLTAPLPVANDLEFLVDTFAAETAPYDQVNLLDLASLLGNVDVEMLDAIVQIVDLATNIPNPLAGQSVFIPLGEVIVVDGKTNPGNVTAENASVTAKDVLDELNNFAGNDAQEQFAQESSAFLDSMTSIPGGGFQFPIIDNPASLLGVLLGQDATLFAYQTPQLSADFSMGVTVPITGPLSVEFVGGIGVSAQFAFGYDTRGLREFVDSRDPVDLVDGFFVSDREFADGTGADIDEVTLRGSLEAFATLTAGVASASVGGGIYATVGANLNDTSGDGKVRLNELLNNLPLCAFDLAGSLSAGLRVKAQVLGAPFSQNIATVKLLEFGHSCSPAQSLALGEIDSDGVYNVFVGDTASQREVGEGIVDEYVTFAPTLDAAGNAAIEVSGFGITEVISGVTAIRAHSGDGNDSLVVLGSIDVPVEFSGGQGNDELVGGNLDDILHGGGGDDLIQGNNGDDEIRGGAGINTLEGGSGDDSITGGDRDDFIDAGTGDDSVHAGRGNDTILGGDGMDSVDAGDGDDRIFGGKGSDWIRAGDGDDEVFGGVGDDAIEAGDGEDFVDAGAGADYVHGGRGIDRLRGGAGDDLLFGGFDADFLDGYDGDDILIGGNDATENVRDDSADTIRGDAGDDILIGDDGAVLDFDGTFHIIEVIGGGGDDYLEGGLGNDWAHGVGGNDGLHGGGGHDHLIGGDGDDEIFGNEGADWLEGRDGADRIFGHAGGDLIGGGRGADYLDGGDDEDQIYAHETGGGEPWFVGRKETEDDAAEDTLLGRDGPDEIVGGLGDDTIDGGAGSDAILDRGGDDSIRGGLGNDYMEITQGHDTIFGQWGNDEFAIGTNGFARIDGQHGTKLPRATGLGNEAQNKMLVHYPDVELDFVEALTNQVTDIDHLDASFTTGFAVRLDPNAVRQMTDADNTLRLDFARDASIQLDGDWHEIDGIEFDGVAYRRLTSQDVTLVVRDLKPQQREDEPHDVNGDGQVTPLDALLVINHLNRQQDSQSFVFTPTGEQNLFDVTGDNWISPIDALRVINELNGRNDGQGEGELPIDLGSLEKRKKREDICQTN
jgi:Ca2+-binding RTX toxin-like protein